MKLHVLGALWLAPLAGTVLLAGPTTRPAAPTYAPTSDYEPRKLEGWTVRVHKDLLNDANSELLADAWAELQAQLYHVRRVLPAKALAETRKVVIWLEYDNPKQDNACYHPSRGWLTGNGYNPDKTKSVELGNARHFLKAVGHQPFMLLHELAHAYHDRVLGFGHARIRKAYEAAKASKRYEKVLIWNGRKNRHYAMTNDKEYFAEMSEAWFGTNDIYPFVRAELREYDPNTAKLIPEMWKTAR